MRGNLDDEKNEYLKKEDKREKEKHNNLDDNEKEQIQK